MRNLGDLRGFSPLALVLVHEPARKHHMDPPAESIYLVGAVLYLLRRTVKVLATFFIAVLLSFSFLVQGMWSDRWGRSIWKAERIKGWALDLSFSAQERMENRTEQNRTICNGGGVGGGSGSGKQMICPLKIAKTQLKRNYLRPGFRFGADLTSARCRGKSKIKLKYLTARKEGLQVRGRDY